MNVVVNFMTQRFPFFIVAYFTIQIIIRLLTSSIVVLDESEQIMLSQYFSLGYNEQPPLYTWLQMGVFKVFGISVFGLALLKNILLCLTYLYIYKLGLLLLNDKLKASLGALSLMLIPQLVWDAQVDQTHTVLLTTATTLTLYYFFKIAIENAFVSNFVLFGIFSGVGLMAKYNFILVLIALGIMASLIKEFRIHFYNKRLIIAMGIALVFVLPHFIWFISHLDIATHRTIERMNVGHTGSALSNFFKGSLDLVVSCVVFLTPFWMIFVILFRKKFAFSFNTHAKALLGYSIIIFIFLFVMVAMSGTTHIKERWLQPYLVFVPLFLFLHVSSLEGDKNIQKYLSLILIASVSVASVVLIRPFTIDMRGKPTRAAYPFVQLTQKIQEKVQDTDKLLIYAEDKYLGGNMKLFFPNATVITPSLPNQPYMLNSRLVVIWENDKPLTFIQMVQDKDYNCSQEVEKIPFQHSTKLFYTAHYMICEKVK